VALLAAQTSELVQVRVCMALAAVAVDSFILTLDLMAVCAEQVVVYPFEFELCLFFMVECLRLPVERSVALAAILIELPFVYIFMAVYALLRLGLVLLVLMAFIALGILMFADKGVLRFKVVVKCRLFPVFRVMAFLAEAAQLLFMHILLLVASKAFLGGLAVFTLRMTLIALRFFMFPAQLECAVLCGMVVGCLFPTLCGMAGFTCFILELSFMRVFMAVSSLACLEVSLVV